MNGGFWSKSRRMGRAGFHSDVKEKLKKELPQQLAQNRDKLKKDESDKKSK